MVKPVFEVCKTPPPEGGFCEGLTQAKREKLIPKESPNKIPIKIFLIFLNYKQLFLFFKVLCENKNFNLKYLI